MIDEYQLIEFANNFKDIRQLEKDYLLTLLLREISSVFSSELIFKGGTALKYFYNLNRFSEDLDFSCNEDCVDIDSRHIIEKMNKAFSNLNMQYPITEKDVRFNKVGDKIVGINYMLRVNGPLNQRLNHLQNIKVDVSLKHDLIFKPELKYLSPVYQDILTFSLDVMSIDEILAEKVASIIERDKMRDIYDVYYLLMIKSIKYSEKNVKKKMEKRRESFEKTKLSQKLEFAEDKMNWRSELAYLITPLPDNVEVISKLKKAMDL